MSPPAQVPARQALRVACKLGTLAGPTSSAAGKGGPRRSFGPLSRQRVAQDGVEEQALQGAQSPFFIEPRKGRGIHRHRQTGRQAHSSWQAATGGARACKAQRDLEKSRLETVKEFPERGATVPRQA